MATAAATFTYERGRPGTARQYATPTRKMVRAATGSDGAE